MPQFTGMVKWFNNAKGYGFLGHEGGPDVFVDYTSVFVEAHTSLIEGDPSELEIAQKTKGPQSENIIFKKKGRGTNSG